MRNRAQPGLDSRKDLNMKNARLSLFTIAALGVVAGLQSAAFAADYTVDPGHSRIGFTVRHIVSKVSGEFKDVSGNFSFDEKKPAAAAGSFEAKTDSISTNNDKRDTHLKSPDFFDAQKFPKLTLTNVKLSANGSKKYKLSGDLTMHGVTKPVVFDMEFLGADKDPWGGTRAGFTAKTHINRKDFGLSWNKTLESGGLLVGDEVEITLDVEGVQAAPKKS